MAYEDFDDQPKPSKYDGLKAAAVAGAGVTFVAGLAGLSQYLTYADGHTRNREASELRTEMARDGFSGSEAYADQVFRNRRATVSLHIAGCPELITAVVDYDIATHGSREDVTDATNYTVYGPFHTYHFSNALDPIVQQMGCNY